MLSVNSVLVKYLCSHLRTVRLTACQRQPQYPIPSALRSAGSAGLSGLAPRTARERVREEMTAEILAVAGAHLARDGAPALSLRSIARDLGMAPSALYRYFDGRDALLSALILAAYEALATEAERAADQAEDRRGAGGGRRGRAMAGRPARPPSLGPRAPAPVGADLRYAGPGLRGARGHRRALHPGGRRPGAPARRGGGVGALPPGRRAAGGVGRTAGGGGAGERRAPPRPAGREGGAGARGVVHASSAPSASRCSGTGATPCSSPRCSSRPPCASWPSRSAWA